MTKKITDKIVEELEELDEDMAAEADERDKDDDDDDLEGQPYSIYVLTFKDGTHMVSAARWNDLIVECYCPLVISSTVDKRTARQYHDFDIPCPHSTDRMYAYNKSDILSIQSPRYSVHRDYLMNYKELYEEQEIVDKEDEAFDKATLDQEERIRKLEDKNKEENPSETEEPDGNQEESGLLIDKKSDKVPVGFSIANVRFKDDVKPN